MLNKIPSRFSIIPVRNKTPLVPWKEFTTRRAAEQEIQKWKDTLGQFDWGIVTGPVSGILVLDLDDERALAEAKRLGLPRTPHVKTRKGDHFYFRWTGDLDSRITTRVGIANKTDTRGGDNGFVVFYGWTVSPYVCPLARPPQWLIDKLPKKEGGEIIRKGKAIEIISRIEQGNRNDSFARLAGSLRGKGYDIETMFELLRPKAREVNFPEAELMTICRSIGRYDAPVSSLGGQGIADFLKEQKPVKWICEPFFAEGCIGIIAGLPESRKSWIMVDLAVEMARGGGLWLNKFPVKAGKVLLIDQERGKSEIQRRLNAVIAAKQINVQSMQSTLFVQAGTAIHIDQPETFRDLQRQLCELRPNLLLIDSFATIHGKQETNRYEIQQVMERLKRLREEYGCAVIFIHHETKGAYQSHKEGAESTFLDMSGNVAIPAAAEVCLGVRKHDEESSFVFHTKSTQGSKAAPFCVRVKDVEKGIIVEAF
jgi:hypothetical protein